MYYQLNDRKSRESCGIVMLIPDQECDMEKYFANCKEDISESWETFQSPGQREVDSEDVNAFVEWHNKVSSVVQIERIFIEIIQP